MSFENIRRRKLLKIRKKIERLQESKKEQLKGTMKTRKISKIKKIHNTTRGILNSLKSQELNIVNYYILSTIYKYTNYVLNLTIYESKPRKKMLNNFN